MLSGCISSDTDEQESSVQFHLSKLRRKITWTLSEISLTSQSVRLKELLIS